MLQALWIALTGRYPLAFDEEFHLGVIRLYADHISPFWSGHPAGGDAFGAVSRDPSYLFHWLMSFPYRLISALTDNAAAQVIFLRLINIGLFACGLWLYRLLLLRVRASRVLVHLSLLIFTLVPMVPYLAAQINYDNLLLPLTGGALILALKLNASLKAASLDAKSLLLLIALLMFATLVKHAFLPIAAAIALFLTARGFLVYRSLPRLWRAMSVSARQLSRPILFGLCALLIGAGILFVERYGVNLVRYHAPVADCGQVLGYEHCQHYGPWIRDYNLERNKDGFTANPLSFTRAWIEGMWFRSFFGVSGPAANYQNSGPLLLPALAGLIGAGIGLTALILKARTLWRRYDASVLWLFLAATATYLAVLWLDVYMLYARAGTPVAINGRYLIPLLPVMILVAAMAVNALLKNHDRLKLAAAVLVMICFLWGGGALTYVLRSSDGWYWPGTPLKGTNQAVKKALGPVTPGYGNPHLFRPD